MPAYASAQKTKVDATPSRNASPVAAPLGAARGVLIGSVVCLGFWIAVAALFLA